MNNEVEFFFSSTFCTYLIKNEIVHQISYVDSSQKNRIIENKYLLDVVQTFCYTPWEYQNIYGDKLF